jgi:hypothetical protein
VGRGGAGGNTLSALQISWKVIPYFSQNALAIMIEMVSLIEIRLCRLLQR